MSSGRLNPTAILLSILLALLALGCGSELRQQVAPNQPPEIRLERPVVLSTHEHVLGYSMSWKAQDSDGRVDHYLYAFDPAAVDRVDPRWSRSRETSTRIHFARSNAQGRLAPVSLRPREYHVFAVRAVDDRGAESPTATQAMFEDNVAPQVFIEDPPHSNLFTPIITNSPTITWRGVDPDGQIVRYKYRLFGRVNPDFPEIQDFISLVMQNPDTLRALYGPDFDGWEASGPAKTSVHYTDLESDQFYLFAVTAFDNRGDYDPVFILGKSLVRFIATDSPSLGPKICVVSPLLNYCQVTWNSNAPTVELPAESSIPLSWVASAPAGANIIAYRWALDPEEPLDDRQRAWTPWRLQNTSTTLDPFSGAGEHLFVVQVKDNNGLVGTLRLRLVVIQARFDKDLLVVDDTRLILDQRNSSGGIEPPRGDWPTAAELDTFLYARGGFPWRGYPEGTTSGPGILAGYSFDTLGTRGLAGGIVPLTVLSRYRHVIWMTDAIGSTFTGSPLERLAPITSLRLMSIPGYQSTLATYVQQGGKLWLLGGGAAFATLASWNRRDTPPDEFRNADGEVVSGRLMYDFAYWRSGIKMSPAQQALLNVPQVVGDPTAAPGRGWAGQPFYPKLEPRASILGQRTCASDPPSPLRACNSFYLVRYYSGEYLFMPNAIVEDLDPRPNHERLVSVLDTLYVATGGTLSVERPIMTYYHGSQSAPLVFSGFPLWHFQRQQCADLTDFVLQDIWGLVKQPTVGQSVAHAARRR